MSYTSYRVYMLVFVATSYCLSTSSGARTKRPSAFHAIGMKVETDKVNSHHYDTLYDKYLQPISGEKLRLLEGKEHFRTVRSTLKRMTRDFLSVPALQLGLAATCRMVRATHWR